MNSYHSHIINLLVENGSMDRTDLFAKSGVKDKREFIKEVGNLIAEKRLLCEGPLGGENKSVLFPKVLKLVEFENRNNALTRIFLINYAPTKVLEKALEYIEPGADPFEDKLDFHLEIMGYPLKEKYKGFFEKENGFTLDFTKFHYNLWAEYLHYVNKNTDPPHIPNIIYVDADIKVVENFKLKIKDRFITEYNWYHFTNYTEAYDFFENTLKERIFIDLIVLHNNSKSHICDYLVKFEKLIKQFEEVYEDLIIPTIILDEPSLEIDFAAMKIDKTRKYYCYPVNEDEYIIGNVMKMFIQKS